MTKKDNPRARLRTGIIMALVIIAAFFPFGAWPLRILLVCISLIATRELSDMIIRILENKPQCPTPPRYSPSPIPLTAALIIIVGGASIVVCDQLYLGLLIIATVGYDIFAYTIGKRIGRKLIKKSPFSIISPSKSWEGLIGGCLASIALSQLYLLIARLLGVNGIPNLPLLFFSISMTIAAAAGDYVCSCIKRLALTDDGGTIISFKPYFCPSQVVIDTGRIIPGHGGIIDRFLSMFTVATLLFITNLIYSTAKLFL